MYIYIYIYIYIDIYIHIYICVYIHIGSPFSRSKRVPGVLGDKIGVSPQKKEKGKERGGVHHPFGLVIKLGLRHPRKKERTKDGLSISTNYPLHIVFEVSTLYVL